MTTGITAHGLDLAVIFGAKGSSTAAATGIKVSGTDLNLLLLAKADGVAVTTPTGIKSNGSDLINFFGAPATSLPINGGTYTATLTRDGTSGANAYVEFVISGGGTAWALTSGGTAGTVSPGGNFAGGSVPSGSSTVKYTYANVTGATTTVTGTINSQVAVSTNPLIKANISSAGTIGTGNGSAQITIVFYNSSGTAISTTTFTADMVIQN